MPSNPIAVARIQVKRGRIVCDVRIVNPAHRYTDPRLAAAVLARFPTLRAHACVNARGKTFGSVIEHTSLAHLLEHLWIELQVRASTDEQARFVGTTEWLDEATGTARIQMSYRDDLQALRTFNEAASFLNNAVLR